MQSPPLHADPHNQLLPAAPCILASPGTDQSEPGGHLLSLLSLVSRPVSHCLCASALQTTASQLLPIITSLPWERKPNSRWPTMARRVSPDLLIPVFRVASPTFFRWAWIRIALVCPFQVIGFMSCAGQETVLTGLEVPSMVLHTLGQITLFLTPAIHATARATQYL